jgi:L-rhamnose mutarotase
MIRRAFTMRLKPGAMAEYRQHHDNIWPELVREIEESGIAHFTTFERDPELFLYSEIYDEKAWDRLWNTEIHKKWGEVMSQLMQFKDGIVDASEVKEIFHFEPKSKARRKPAAKKKPVKRISKSKKKVRR